jgi:hypothetical protein
MFTHSKGGFTCSLFLIILALRSFENNSKPMTLSKIKFLSNFLLFCCCLQSAAQHTIRSSNIDLITIKKNGRPALYKKLDSLHYQEVVFELYDDIDDISLKGKIHKDEFAVNETLYDTLTLSQIRKNHTFIIHESEIAPVTYPYNLHTNWEKTYTSYETQYKNIFQVVNKYIAVSHHFYRRKSKNTTQKNTWKTLGSGFKFIVCVEFGNDKKLILLFNSYDVSDLFLIANNKTIPLEFFSNSATFKETTNTSYDFLKYEQYRDFTFRYFYRIHQTKDELYEVRTLLGDKLLPGSYDMIEHSDFFIIAKKNHKYTVFDTSGNEIPLGNIYDYYLHYDILELLTEDGAFFYHFNENRPDSIPNSTLTICGHATYKKYEIDAKTKRHIYVTSTSNRDWDKVQKVIFRNLPKEEEIYFTGDKNAIYIYGFESLDSGKKQHLLKIKKDNRYGIRSYNYYFPDTSAATDTIFSQKQLMYKNPFLADTKLELPARFDSITKEKNGLIRFYKKGKIGIFPSHKSVQYKSLEKVTDCFYRIRRRNKKGWLNIKTMEEYFFD